MATTKTALMLVANGTEEMEAVVTIDVLRRAQITVTIAAVGLHTATTESNSVTPLVVTCSREVRLVADTRVEDLCQPHSEEFKAFDAVVVPGGLDGARRMAESPHVKRLLHLAWTGGFVVAGICAGPIALKAANVGLTGEITSHPSVKDELTSAYKYSEARVVVSHLSEAKLLAAAPSTTATDDAVTTTTSRRVGTVITSRGPGTAYEFALSIVKHLCGAEKAAEVMKPMVLWEELKLV